MESQTISNPPHTWKSMDEFEEFRILVRAHRKEVMAMLFQIATDDWCKAHVAVAKCDNEIAKAKAEMNLLQQMIEYQSKAEQLLAG